jgi:methionine-S-sulfoxide reductase
MLPHVHRLVAALIPRTPPGARRRDGEPSADATVQRRGPCPNSLLALLSAPLLALAAVPLDAARHAVRRDVSPPAGWRSHAGGPSVGCPVRGSAAMALAAIVLGLLGLAASPADEPAPQRERAILAGGCFWGMEEILRKIPGVESTTVGYTGGNTPAPTYQQVCAGLTGHAEAVEIVFDPGVLPYEKLLEYFFRMHDPTTPNRQHNDVGTQYRSAIFWTTPEQEATARGVIAEVTKAGRFRRPIVTQVVKAGPFFAAEAYHQDYLIKNPAGYNCHVLQDW